MSAVQTSKSGIDMSQNNKLSILARAREILSAQWGKGSLRSSDGTYCLLGACEQAAYDLGLATEDPDNSFDESYWDDTEEALGYLLGHDLSLNTYAKERFPDDDNISSAWQVNDRIGREATLSFLDDYIVKVEQGRPR